MTLLSFKNVGIKQFQTENILTGSSKIPIGPKTPLEYGSNGEGLFKMHYVVSDQVQDNLKNLILTNHGERLVQYDFGANLKPLLTEYSNKDNFDGAAMVGIATAVAKYMPYIGLTGFNSEPVYENNLFMGKIKIQIIYNVVNLNIFDKKLEILLYVI